MNIYFKYSDDGCWILDPNDYRLYFPYDKHRFNHNAKDYCLDLICDTLGGEIIGKIEIDDLDKFEILTKGWLIGYSGIRHHQVVNAVITTYRRNLRLDSILES